MKMDIEMNCFQLKTARTYVIIIRGKTQILINKMQNLNFIAIIIGFYIVWNDVLRVC